ncbi:MAG: NACHT domain-containing protein [Sideroxyarcus sp.]|nr:NACHT domain-containing protein [Sideroxyarcus sp.]
MERQKKLEQIHSLESEVKQLHPLLDELFRHLDSIVYVENTHGTNEMGADFVLEKHDKTIGDTHYIGVVVKADKILSNITEVHRQIGECKYKRFIKQGKEEVRLPEVWVITSKSISHNAKLKICDDYPDKKIHFFDADWLVDNIDKHMSLWWHQLPTATGAYLAKLTKQLVELDAQTSVLNLPSTSPNCYIELEVEEIETDRYKKKVRQKSHVVNFQDEVLNHKVSLLEADMGYGKSKLARRIATDLAAPQVLKATKVLPIFQPFAVFVDAEFVSLESKIEKLIGLDCYKESIENGIKFLLILDGIDEANGNADKATSVLKELIAQTRASSNVHILFTSRPYKLVDEVPDLAVTAKRYKIRPISIGKLIKFLNDVCSAANLPKKLYEDLAKSQLFKQLPQNPIAASLLSNLLSQNKKELPSNLTELYSKSIEFMLGRWDEKRSVSSEKLYKSCERLARYLARHMIENHLAYLPSEAAKSMCSKFLQERNMGISVEDAFDYLVSRSNLFGKLDGTETLFFRHRSFAEYLFALDAQALRNQEFDERAFHPYWTNVYFFYIGLLGECPAELAALVNTKTENEGSQWLRLLQMGNYFLAGYQSPYSVVEAGLDVLVIDAATLFLNVKNGNTKTQLGTLPEMQVLWLFAMLMKQGYGYDYFKKALPFTLLKIEDNQKIDQPTKQYALFLASCALAELGSLEGFNYILENYKTEDLPLSISLALTCEVGFTNKDFAKNALIKHHDKKLKKLLSANKIEGNIGINNKIKELFERPLHVGNKSKIEQK